ncbi:hypothetical protein H0H81_008980 [Sphagnurus paluster]|uniref:Peptidase A1 domain-containing protein n=1 Tax=Sphagnurus paluster TaxID=117069 RepID=A0A9P7K4I1_9AGAR|nr:hypothetical protein H0H81_008980 [Sphagnurus paluster]
MSFGGKLWPINPADMNLGRVSRGSTQCVGGIFDLSLGSNITPGSGNPSWVVGATFLKNVYAVYRSSPPSIGFAQLSAAAGGSGTPSSSPVSSSSLVLTTSAFGTSFPTSSGTPGAAPGGTGSNGSTTGNGGNTSIQITKGAVFAAVLASLFAGLF